MSLEQTTTVAENERKSKCEFVVAVVNKTVVSRAGFYNWDQ